MSKAAAPKKSSLVETASKKCSLIGQEPELSNTASKSPSVSQKSSVASLPPRKLTAQQSRDLSPPHSVHKSSSSSRAGSGDAGSRKESVASRKDSGKSDKLAKDLEAVKLENADSRDLPNLPTPKEYPDSDDDEDSNRRPFRIGTTTEWQSDNLEKFYKEHGKFPSADAVKKFGQLFSMTEMIAETWLEARRQQSYQKYVEKGLQTDPSVMQFYCEALKVAEGIRLEHPNIQHKSFFSLDGINRLEQKKEEADKLIPVLTVSSNKMFVSAKKEEKFQVTIKNEGEVNAVYQISMINADNYVMSPICAILHPDEELTLNITRKKGNLLEGEFFRIDYGLAPEGLIDARESADRADLSGREIVEVVEIDEKEMKVVR